MNWINTQKVSRSVGERHKTWRRSSITRPSSRRHLLLALLRQEEGVVPALVTQVAGSALALRMKVQSELEKPRKLWEPATGGAVTPGCGCVSAAERYAQGHARRICVHRAYPARLTEGLKASAWRNGLTKDAILKALASLRGSQRVTSQTPEDTYRRWKIRARPDGPGAPG